MSALMDAKKSQFAFICDRCASDSKAISQHIVGGVGTDSICSWCSRSLTQVAYTGEVLDPFIGQHGQMTSSSSLALDLSRRHVWDVNGYYRELGVSPHATKAELRRAYQESSQNDRLTYIAKTLLDHETRIQYDLLKVGQLWFDPWLSARVREEMLDEVQGQDIAEEGEVTVRQDLLEREDHPINISPVEDPWSPSGWGHYTWHIGPRDWLMSRWRLMLSLAARELGMTIPDLMVGVMRGEQPWAVYQLSAGRTIFFLEEHAVASTELARSAIVSLAT